MEKVDNAIKETNEQNKKFETQNAKNEKCLNKLKEFINKKNEDSKVESLFTLYKHCIRVDREMENVKSLLIQRKTFLSQESKSCKKYTSN